MKAFPRYTSGLMLTTAILLFAVVHGCSENPEQDAKGFPLREVIRVGPLNFSSSFSYYNTSPESPDGKLISYVKYLSVPEKERYEAIEGEIWICNNDLSNHRKVVDIKLRGVHNGARVQWLDNESFAYQDDSIRAVSIQGKELIQPVQGTIGHKTFNGKFLYSSIDQGSGLYSIFEYDVSSQRREKLADVRDYTEIDAAFPSTDFIPVDERKILHLQYSPDGSKIAFRLDVGSKDEQYKHLITQNIDGSDVRFFGPKPMHFAWFDDSSIMGHDNQIDDGMPNDRSGRRWDLDRNYIETISGIGNHLGASHNREFFASESWYKQNPIILKAFKKGETVPFWQDTVSTTSEVTWKLGNHVNPSFSQDDKRLYFNNYSEEGLVQAYMVVLSE